ASPQTITLTGTNNFNDNTGKGAFLVGYGKITASNVTANWNIGAAGLDLNNQNSDSTARPLAAITLSGINTFLGNTQSGLMVEATGSISVSTVIELGSSSFTNSPGVYLDTGLLPGTPSVTINTLTASDNYRGGLRVNTAGVVTGSNLTVNGNGFGVSADGASF